MLSRWQRWVIGLVGLVFVALISLPYLYAWRGTGPGEVFGGFLFNPLDGNSYLAKMRVGLSGQWRYTFPYTPVDTGGGYLFLLYPALGHLARLLSLELVWVYHLARLAGALFLLVALHHFFRTTLPDTGSAGLAWIFAALGSGLGWIALPFGEITMDVWVAEAYPFLSSYANPHFPLSLGLLAYLVAWQGALHPEDAHNGTRYVLRRAAGAAALGLPLAILSPFAVVVGLAILTCMSGIASYAYHDRRLARYFIFRATGAGLGGLPVMAYYVWLTRIDPVIAVWNAQNLTPSASVLDLIISFSPLLWLGLASLVWLVRRGMHPDVSPAEPIFPQKSHLLLVWIGVGILMAYLPLGLQRRFLLGLFIPIAGLAALVVKRLWQAPGKQRVRLALVGILLLAFPTNLMVIFTSLHGVQTREPVFYLHPEEVRAFQWLADNSSTDSVVLAAPQTSMYLPAYSGRRVVYGHPFETAHAAEREAAVNAFFQGDMGSTQVREFLAQNRVTYIFYGPRERASGGWLPAGLAGPVFEQGEVAIFRYTAALVNAGWPVVAD